MPTGIARARIFQTFKAGDEPVHVSSSTHRIQNASVEAIASQHASSNALVKLFQMQFPCRDGDRRLPRPGELTIILVVVYR